MATLKHIDAARRNRALSCGSRYSKAVVLHNDHTETCGPMSQYRLREHELLRVAGQKLENRRNEPNATDRWAT